jgi:hypothetical protein
MQRRSVMTGYAMLGILAALTLARAESPPAVQGCSQLENWVGRGAADTGMKFVDLVIGKWQEVWTHPMVHVACSGGAGPDGSYRIEGLIQPPPGDGMDAIRGIWILGTDGTIREELLRLDGESGRWETFYSGVSRRSAGTLQASATS